MALPERLGKYLLLQRISVGGMAEVFQAKSFGVEGFEKVVAVKRILPSLAGERELVRMFIDEARIAGQLSHANICHIFELGKIAESHFIAMEYVWGKDLLQIQNRFKKIPQHFPFQMAAFIVTKICDGLDYAHRKKDREGSPLAIVHRDVSPENILVSYEGEVKIIDFGIAKAALNSTKTKIGTIKGKFGYMSPEQVRGLPLDRRSDIFAVGTLLYEMLTGERAFLGETDFATLEKIRHVNIVPPTQINAEIPPQLEAIVLKALAKNVEDRHQWANELGEDLSAFIMSQAPAYSGMNLARWMREAFQAEIESERVVFEEQKKATNASPSEGQDVDCWLESTDVSGPILLGNESASVSDEMPTQIFDTRAESAGEPAPRNAETPTKVFGALPESETSSELFGMPAPVAIDPHPFRSAFENPCEPNAEVSPDGSAGESPLAAAESELSARPHSMGFWTELAIGAGAFVVLLTIVIVSYTLHAKKTRSDENAQEKTRARGTILVSADADEPAEVFVNGARKGTAKVGEPLKIEGLPKGEYSVEVRTREEAKGCTQSVVLGERPTEVVMCNVAKGAELATLKLSIMTPDAIVLVDNQEISSDAAREPLMLLPNVSHEIVIKKSGFLPETIVVILRSGETSERRVELLPEKALLIEVAPLRKLPPSGKPPLFSGGEVKPPELVSSTPAPIPEPTPPVESAGKVEAGGEALMIPAWVQAKVEEEEKAPPPPRPDASGYLIANSTPWGARVLVDDKDTGRVTPVSSRAKIPLKPGRHTITFILAGRRFSYPVVIGPGEDHRLNEKLPLDQP